MKTVFKIAVVIGSFTWLLSSCSKINSNSATDTPANSLNSGIQISASSVMPIDPTVSGRYYYLQVNNSSDSLMNLTTASVNNKFFNIKDNHKMQSSSDFALVDTSNCSHIQPRGSCTIKITPPNLPSSDVISLTFNNGTNDYTAQQLISYDVLQGYQGFILNNKSFTVVVPEGAKGTYAVPFILDDNYTSIDINTLSPNTSVQLLCSGKTKGSFCTAIATTSLVNQNITLNLVGRTTSNTYNRTGLVYNVSNAAKANLVTTSSIVKVVADGTSKAITIINNGNSTATNLSFSSVPSTAPVTFTHGTCGVNLDAGSRCQFNLSANSTINGQATVNINYGGGISPSTSFNLIYSASVVSAPALNLSSNGDFTNMVVDESKVVQVTLTNSGQNVFTRINLPNISSQNADMQYDNTGISNACALDNSSTLAVGTSCNVGIRYTPRVAGSGFITFRPVATYLDPKTGSSINFSSSSVSINYLTYDSLAKITMSSEDTSGGILPFIIPANGVESSIHFITLTNTGGVTTTYNISFPSQVYQITKGGTTTAFCGSGGTLPSYASCTFGLQYGPKDTVESITDAILVSYKAKLNDSEYTIESLPVSLIAKNAAIIDVATTVDTTGATGLLGSGTNLDAYSFTIVNNNKITLNYSYTNRGTATANNFYVATNELPVGYVVENNNCINSDETLIGLESSNSCSIIVSLPDYDLVNTGMDLSGTKNVNPASVSYEDNNGFYSMIFDDKQLYVTLNNFVQVSVSSLIVNSLKPGYIRVPLKFDISNFQSSSGINYPLTISVDQSSLGDGFNFESGNECNVIETTNSCTIFIDSTPSTSIESYSFFYSVSATGSSTILSGIGYFDLSTATQTLVFPSGSYVYMGGDTNSLATGYSGTKGVAHNMNMPYGMSYPITWVTDNKLYIMGERGSEYNNNTNRLWQFDFITNLWTWISGDANIQNGIYGTLGIESSINQPGPRQGGASFVDSNGDLWLFGGFGNDKDGSNGVLNDLWKFNVTTHNWTWMGGESVVNATGQFNGVGNVGYPMAAAYGSSWSDKHGNFWLFGGYTGNFQLNDLWKFDVSNNQWIFVKGSHIPDDVGIYGSQGVADDSVTPGAISEAASTIDAQGNLWLFGGVETSGVFDRNETNNLWKFNTDTLQWTWISGGSNGTNLSVYGTKGVPDITNMIGERNDAVMCADEQNQLWIFGGNAYDGINYAATNNELWVYNLDTNKWTFVNGNQLSGSTTFSSIKGIIGIPDITNEISELSGGACAFETSKNTMLFFGGYGKNSNISNELWLYATDLFNQ